ncbi:E3 ubiquitin-protein ligase RNF34-like isoform X2 [Corythoichthys intestinalis]|uniref:E3 ubiquitin-protein ligase RNF34-like isoform X2 n=1 Tax=Corythoichthys intestinalis TaxID=161448 RepID=UPI0025A4ED1A|nr:E3 ubiquitin-protein ligase RNF34-like isoform X2 [Corythoichthys intestinalis]
MFSQKEKNGIKDITRKINKINLNSLNVTMASQEHFNFKPPVGGDKQLSCLVCGHVTKQKKNPVRSRSLQQQRSHGGTIIRQFRGLSRRPPSNEYAVNLSVFSRHTGAAMKAGASSVWASCCGLLNEVMGTGAVRGQQPGFGAGAGPFRFTSSAGYSTYPPTSSGSPSLVCKSCGLAFSVFRRKHICCDCKKSFCSLCSVPLENVRVCATCHLLKATSFHRPRLMRLRVRDLRQYLLLHNVPTDTCREKEDLVDLVLCHQGSEEEEEEEEELDTSSLHSRSIYTPPPSTTQSASELSQLAASREEPLSRSDSSDSSQDIGDATSVSLLNLDPSDPTPETSPQTQRLLRASLSDISSISDIEGLSVRQLKEILARNFVNYSGCCEKWELVERVSRLYRETEENRKSLENVSSTLTKDGEKGPPMFLDENLCRICMDAVIDCVLLECGHMVTCTKCGKRMSECPICRQYVVRAVHVFKS